MSDPHLHRLDAPVRATGLVLMLHGGTPDSLRPVNGRSASWRRSRWMQRQIAGGARAHGVGVWLLRYRHRGWNAGAAGRPSPVLDVAWGLEQVRREHGALPVVLLGHSMGARAAVAAAEDPLVTGVVGLAPWLPPDDPVQPLSGKHFAAAHGRADRITGFAATASFVRRAGAVAVDTEMVDMGPVGHYMLRRTRAWNDFALSRSLSFLREHAAD